MSKNTDLLVEKITTVGPKSTNTKALYIVVTEDSTVKTKVRLYSTHRVDQNPIAAEIVGYEVDDSTIAQIKSAETYNDAVEVAKSKGGELETLIIPWHKIVRIKKFTFSTKTSA